MLKNEYDANKALQDSAAMSVVYSEKWMRPARNAGRFKRTGWLRRLIVWIAGH